MSAQEIQLQKVQAKKLKSKPKAAAPSSSVSASVGKNCRSKFLTIPIQFPIFSANLIHLLDLADYGLNIAPGTLTGGLKTLAPPVRRNKMA